MTLVTCCCMTSYEDHDMSSSLILYPWGGLTLHCQVEHHMRDKFATHILYDIDNFKFYDIFLHIHNH